VVGGTSEFGLAFVNGSNIDARLSDVKIQIYTDPDLYIQIYTVLPLTW
jgi:hypothetical protein